MMAAAAKETGEGEHQEAFVEVDPSGRYGRYNEILGRGSSKTVYRAFDEYEGIEVAWNQVKLLDFLKSPEELERLYCEIHLLKTLKHRNIMKFYTSWVDTSRRNINFVTEMFTSGTLRQYRQKHRKVNIRAVKNWCRQILNGLVYLHGQDPPVIHRDLKCDNIFINGNQGQVKIGDLGLAAILRKSHAEHCVGTPEFMAPEVFEEQYNELVDIYSFGMCILEMVTFEYPYSECTNPAQIYKKVVSGTKPDSLYKVEDPEVRRFVEKCLATVSERLPARELLMDPFLRIDDVSPSSWDDDAVNALDSIPNDPSFSLPSNCKVEEPNVDITIKGKRHKDGSIELKLRIVDRRGGKRSIVFLFDTELDTAMSVATEMVAELDIVDFDVMNIAEMIDMEVSSLVPDWKPGPGFEEISAFPSSLLCDNCASTVTSCGSLSEILYGKNPGNLPSPYCSRVGCMHGRFAEYTYRVEGASGQLPQGELVPSITPDTEISLQASLDCQLATEIEKTTPSWIVERISDAIQDVDISTLEGMERISSYDQLLGVPKFDSFQHYTPNLVDDYEQEIQEGLAWWKAQYLMESRECGNCHTEGMGNNSSSHTTSDVEMLKRLDTREISSCCLNSSGSELSLAEMGAAVDDDNDNEPHEGYYHNTEFVMVRNCADKNADCTFTAKNLYTCNLLPGCLSQTKSLPVDAIDT